MKQKILFLLFSFLLSYGLQAQKEANWWFFGAGNSLNFNITATVNDNMGRPTDGMPKIGTGNIATVEGCFSLSDKKGNLMIYSDGMTIWDKNGDPLPNGSGLLGGNSSIQSGIIVPYPGSLNKYYAISLAEDLKPSGITYSVVDMNLRGGLGDVVNTQKNIALKSGSTGENIAAVKKIGSNNYWIIHQYISGTTCTFYVWELTSTGFNAPVTYQIACPSSAYSYIGALKFSSDATRFACPVWTQDRMLSGEFDPLTGVISNLKQRTVGFSSNIYSFEFSMSGDHLFMTTYSTPSYSAHISWDDLRNTTKNATNLNLPISNVQMHPDKRIYGISNQSRNLYVIMDPEEGKDAEIRVFTDYLSATARYGLPTFAATYMNIEGDISFCVNTSKDFTVTVSMPDILYTKWNFGDGPLEITDPDISSGKQVRSHIYTKPGKYVITVKSFNASNILLKEENIEVKVNRCIMPVNHNISVMGYYD